MQEVAISEFKAKCLALLEQVRATKKPASHHAIWQAGGRSRTAIGGSGSCALDRIDERHDEDHG
jgi:hypothetical protein